MRTVYAILTLLSCHLLQPDLTFSQEDAVALFKKANFFASAGRYKEALEGYDKVLKQDPQLIHAWNNKGNALAALCRNEEALECFNKALELDSRYAFAWSGKGNALMAMKQYAEALEGYEKAL
ncbi:MAG: tetratricopeptide repeat protein, partial [Candidatus Brocadiales bacterium]